MEGLGERIKLAREKSGLTQNQLGELIGVSGVAIMRYEKDLREPKSKILAKIAQALNVSPAYLMGWGEISKQREDLKVSLEDIANELDISVDKLKKWENHPELVPPEFVQIYKRSIEIMSEIDNKKSLLLYFSKLNSTGQKIAAERVKELTKIPDYKKDKDT